MERRLPEGVRAIASIDARFATELGEEAREIVRLVEAGVALVPGWIVRLTGDGVEERLRATLAHVLRDAEAARVRPLFPTLGARARFEELVPRLDDVRGVDTVDLYVNGFLRSLERDALRPAFGGTLVGFALRVFAVDAGSGGLATSVDPETGDPDVLGVRGRDGAEPFRIDRRSGRVLYRGEGFETDLAETVADLTDRVQLALGRPVEVEWATCGRRAGLLGLRSAHVSGRFVEGHYRRVALVAADEGTVAPLAVDALDRGLGRASERVPGGAVRRIFARPYRRLEVPGKVLGGPMVSLPEAARSAARIGYDVARAMGEDARFVNELPDRLAALGGIDLASASDAKLVESLDLRHGIVAEAFARLDDCRERTRRAIQAMEEVAGALPREAYPALSTPKHTRARARAHQDLSDLARRAGAHLGARDVRTSLPPDLVRRWDEVLRSVAALRPLGIDIVAPAYGASDEDFLRAVRNAPRRRGDALDRARWEAMRRVLAQAKEKPLGAARAGVVTSLGLVLDRIVTSKGELAEALAQAMGLLRDAALEVGRRLASRDVLEDAIDALYLTQGELVEALEGEPGAYASRVRVRREDDARWAMFDAPRRLG